jgi:hypothetical protein
VTLSASIRNMSVALLFGVMNVFSGLPDSDLTMRAAFVITMFSV